MYSNWDEVAMSLGLLQKQLPCLPKSVLPLRSLQLYLSTWTFKRLWQSRGRARDCGMHRILGGGEIAMCGIGGTIPELVYGYEVPCRTGCVANNYLQGSRMVCPSASCTEAEESGIFPEERKR
jgi:hypothetical protein